MPSTTSILNKVKNDYPQFVYKRGDSFLWSPSDRTIYYSDNLDSQAIFLLHELSHALLGHTSYDQDIQLISMERSAWDHTKGLASQYNIDISDEVIQSNLDSYRDWLHSRSVCPKCGANGLQTDKKAYKCLACANKWAVNEARTCALRRYNINS